MRLAGTAASSAPYRTVTPGQVPIEQAARVLHFPVATTALGDGDLFEITVGENAGTVWRLIKTTGQDQATARRIPVVQVERPREW